MNLLELYEHQKDALSLFGLRFADMALVAVEVRNNEVVLRHKGLSTAIQIPPQPREPQRKGSSCGEAENIPRDYGSGA